MRQPHGFIVSGALGYRAARLRPRQTGVAGERRIIARLNLKERAAIDRLVKQSIGRNAFGFERGDKAITRRAAEGFGIVLENELINRLRRQSFVTLEQVY